MLVIEKNIAIPDSRWKAGQRSEYREVVEKMQVGDSILLSRKQANNITGWIKRLGFKPVTRTDGPSRMIRVWKIARSE